MNKEEIKKAIKVVFNEECKECYFPKRKCASCVREEKKKIKKHIKQLEQKESILDKVTDKLKEDIDIYKNSKELTEKEQIELEYAKEILNIIEGVKNENKRLY